MTTYFLAHAALLLAADPVAIGDRHYRVYSGGGEPSSFAELVKQVQSRQVVFLGEFHNDPVAHHRELEVLKAAAGADTILSLEMFETDVQGVLDEYMAGLISEDHLISSGRAWRNYKTDYRALIELAKERRFPVVAANAPRRYVNRVSRMGKASLDALGLEAKRLLPPLPYADASPEYTEKFNKFMEEMRKEAAKEAATDSPKPAAEKLPPPSPPRDPKWGLEAQSLWDASMAFSIADTLMRRPNARIVHVNGSFHLEKKLGILDHLSRYRPGVRMLVITMTPAKSFPNWDESLKGAGDFVILTDPSLPRTYSTDPPKPADAAKPQEKK